MCRLLLRIRRACRGHKWRSLVRVDLSLDPRLDDVQWTGDDSCHSSRSTGRKHLQAQSDVAASDPLLCPLLLLLVAGELNSRERQVAPYSGLVSMEEGGKPFLPDDRLRGIHGGAIIVA